MADILERTKSVGAYRDAALVLISVDYLLGYFSWSFYAAQNDLGLLPALDTQYLVAGVLSTMILAGRVVLAVMHVWSSRWTATDPSENRHRVGAILSSLGGAFVLAGVVAGRFLANTPGEDKAVGSWWAGPTS